MLRQVPNALYCSALFWVFIMFLIFFALLFVVFMCINTSCMLTYIHLFPKHLWNVCIRDAGMEGTVHALPCALTPPALTPIIAASTGLCEWIDLTPWDSCLVPLWRSASIFVAQGKNTNGSLYAMHLNIWRLYIELSHL